MFCKQCGNRIDDDSRFCKYCGCSLYGATSVSSTPLQNSDFEIVAGVLKKYKGATVNVVIPNNVLSIGSEAFQYTAIKSVEIPNSVTTIGYAAFRDCSSLEVIHLPNSITQINDYAFDGCSKVNEIEMYDTLKLIGDYAFSFIGQKASTFNLIFHGSVLNSNLLNNKYSVYVRGYGLFTSSYKATAYRCFNSPSLYQGSESNPYEEKEFRIHFYNPLLEKLLELQNAALELQNAAKEYQANNWRKQGLCQFCGGELKKAFMRNAIVCSKCHKDNIYNGLKI